MTKSGEKLVKDLSNDDKIIGYHQEPIDFHISDGPEEDLYDIEIDNPHWYYTSGIVSHNSIALVNAGIANYRMGKKVLHITLELSEQKTKHRYMGALTNEAIIKRKAKREDIERKLQAQRASYGEDLLIYEFPSDEISVNTIYALIKNLRRMERWSPDVVIIDYLELLISRKSDYNREEYKRQKKVTTEIRSFASQENVLVITATQTNRNVGKDQGKDDGGGGVIGLNRIAESYGKAMPIDYMISINRSTDEYQTGRVRLYIAKNRNGPCQETVRAKVDYATMVMKAEL